VGNPGRDAGSASPGRGRAFPLWFGRGRDPCANPVAVAALDLGYPDIAVPYRDGQAGAIGAAVLEHARRNRAVYVDTSYNAGHR